MIGHIQNSPLPGLAVRLELHVPKLWFSVSLGADHRAQTRQGCFLALSLLLCWAGAVLWPKAALGCGISVELDAVLT